MTKEQLLALIAATYTTNGTGDISGLDGKIVLQEMVNSIYTVLENLPITAVDDISIEFNNSGQLAAKYATLGNGLAFPFNTPYARSIRADIPGTSFADGLYIKVDGKTIGMDTTGALCVISGGGAAQEIQNTFVVADDFNRPIVGGDFANAFQSLSGVKGYVKLYSTDNAAYIIKTENFYANLKPGFSSRIILESYAQPSYMALGLVDDIKSLSNNSKGLFFLYDESVSQAWQAVVGDGIATQYIDTGIPFSYEETVLSAFYSDGLAVFLIDGVEVASLQISLPNSVMKVGVITNAESAGANSLLVDYIFASQDQLDDETITFDTNEVFVNYESKQLLLQISQTGTSNPTAIIFKAEFGYPVLARESEGHYTISITDAFLENRVSPAIKTWNTSDGDILTLERIADSRFTLLTKTSLGVLTDGLLDKEEIDIRVFSQNITPLT
jgi:hypothetical protein